MGHISKPIFHSLYRISYTRSLDWNSINDGAYSLRYRRMYALSINIVHLDCLKLNLRQYEIFSARIYVLGRWQLAIYRISFLFLRKTNYCYNPLNLISRLSHKTFTNVVRWRLFCVGFFASTLFRYILVTASALFNFNLKIRFILLRLFILI